MGDGWWRITRRERKFLFDSTERNHVTMQGRIEDYRLCLDIDAAFTANATIVGFMFMSLVSFIVVLVDWLIGEIAE